jgi:hypothetical protein
MDPDVQLRLSPFLESGERLLWTGKPGTGIRVRSGDAFMIPFSVVWAGISAYAAYDAFQEGRPMFNRIWVLPFLVFGVYLVFGRFISDARRRARTLYGVTDRRVIMVKNGGSCTSLELNALPGLTLAPGRNGFGDVVFDTSDGSQVAAGGWVPRGAVAPAMLEFLPNAREVYEIILRAQRRVV